MGNHFNLRRMMHDSDKTMKAVSSARVDNSRGRVILQPCYVEHDRASSAVLFRTRSCPLECHPDHNILTQPCSRRSRITDICPYCPRRSLRGSFPSTRIDNVTSFCIAKNQPVCHYSVRLLTGPRADSVSKRASKGPGSSRTGGGDGGAGGADGGGFVSTGDRCSAVVPLKR